MSRRGLWLVLGAGTVVVLALLVAALSAPVELGSRPRSDATGTPRLEGVLPSVTTTTATSTGPPVGTGGEMSGLVWAVIGIGLVVLGTAALVLVAWLLSLLLGRLRRSRITRHRSAVFASPPLPEELVETAERRMALVESGDPRNGIVAAWLDLEVSAATTGLPRDPAETSTEYTSRVIGTWDVDRVRLAELAALYREARFSTHPLGEQQRRRAASALEVLHRDLARVVAREPEDAGGRV
ncbi:DUF4129 domain-containing protein [Terracoccus luteus]|uniref:Protein-glutamine gamma-glutamyltransferase-like C-terminal domain-containing protein n=1 Tax=Terracoccus luteus TaxID=53356 RepID=A0A839PYF1_9MICO|nr:DUF4129 domain-containing protein [Terracoccus luteus]MBB2987016.1 hypothetical protein [Terracoccus luteus]MCP2172667.1 hypothetical protein [Terracoccus luteus]